MAKIPAALAAARSFGRGTAWGRGGRRLRRPAVGDVLRVAALMVTTTLGTVLWSCDGDAYETCFDSCDEQRDQCVEEAEDVTDAEWSCWTEHEACTDDCCTGQEC